MRPALLVLVLFVSLGCQHVAAGFAVFGKILDAVNTARGIANQALCAAMPDAGSCVPSTSSGGTATDAAGGER